MAGLLSVYPRTYVAKIHTAATLYDPVLFHACFDMDQKGCVFYVSCMTSNDIIFTHHAHLYHTLCHLVHTEGSALHLNHVTVHERYIGLK